jgi:UDP:flavonoid glycosyltransferase YjiC (YdhE family)
MTEACLRRGVAQRPDDGGASIATLRAAIEEVVAGERFRHAARDVAAEIAAMPAPEQVVHVLEELAPARPRR